MKCALDSTRVGADMEFKDMIASPEYCVYNKGETVCRGDDSCHLRWSDARG